MWGMTKSIYIFAFFLTILRSNFPFYPAAGMSVFSAILLWWLIGGTFKWTLYLCGFLSLGHALFRDSNSLQNQQTYTDPMIIPNDAGFYQGPQIVGA